MKLNILVFDNKFSFKINGKLIEENTRSSDLILKMKEENIYNFTGHFKFVNNKDKHMMRFIRQNNNYLIYGFNLVKKSVI